MLKAAEVQAISQQVIQLFSERPDFHVAIKNGVPIYEIIIYAPRVPNVGRGASLSAALNHLKSLHKL